MRRVRETVATRAATVSSCCCNSRNSPVKGDGDGDVMRYTKKKTAAEMCDKCPPLAPVLDTLRCELTDCRLENNIYQTP